MPKLTGGEQSFVGKYFCIGTLGGGGMKNYMLLIYYMISRSTLYCLGPLLALDMIKEGNHHKSSLELGKVSDLLRVRPTVFESPRRIRKVDF